MLDLVPGLHDYLSNPANEDSFIWMPFVDHSPAAHKLSVLVLSLATHVSSRQSTGGERLDWVQSPGSRSLVKE